MGPLHGMTVIEMAGLGPAPFAGMMLADQGANVIRVERPGGMDGRRNVLCRNRSSIMVDLKQAAGAEVVLRLAERAQALIEGFRPGVMERLGLGPQTLLVRSPALVYSRMTGWGQDGPLAGAAGHDINYISLTGVAHAVGRTGGPPVAPLNLVGDYGGGGMLLAFGVMCGVWEAQRSGRGQVIDAAMVDGASTLMAEYWSFLSNGEFSGPRATHLLDGGAHFYGLYETLDGEHVSIGPLEPKFYAELLMRLGLNGHEWLAQNNSSTWPLLKERLQVVFLTRTRAQWTELLEGTDVCFAPVLPLAEVAAHPHNAARNMVLEVGGMQQPAPAPRFSRSAAAKPQPGRLAGADSLAVLERFGFGADERAELVASGVVLQA